MTRPAKSEIAVALFCGGRGSASLIRELLRWPNIRLSLLINAYDDGLSTGALRNFIPGMLGPSDFRKNLSYLLDLYSTQQYALQRLIEYRLPRDVSPADIATLERFARGAAEATVGEPLRGMLAPLDERMQRQIREHLARFFDYARNSDKPFDYADCSLGNLIFAGAYLKSGSFNQAAHELALLMGSRAELVNVSRGECRSLVALKDDGELLSCEAEIVGRQSPVRIRDTYFTDGAVDRAQWALVAERPIPEKETWLLARQMAVELSPEAEARLASADVVIYGPGTQHSSLLPSYRIAGKALHQAPAPLKLFVVNLHADNDIQGLSATDLVDRALFYAGDPTNDRRTITHILYNSEPAGQPDSIPLDRSLLDADGRYRGAAVIEARFANPVEPRVHSGHRIIRTVLDLHENAGTVATGATIDIYMDLLDRSLALEGVLQEFLEIDWKAQFREVRLRINGLEVPALTLPDHLTVTQTHYGSLFSEVAVLLDWLEHGDGDYLVTVTGDGEYRLRDVLLGVSLLRNGSFGAVYGSRTQSRQQFRTSLRSAYGEGTVLFAMSWLGAFVLTALFSLRFRLIFSDPLTGFRIYQRNRLKGAFRAALSARKPVTAASVTRLLIENQVEIAEIPVSYRTFTGFTRPSWRLGRGLRNLAGLVR